MNLNNIFTQFLFTLGSTTHFFSASGFFLAPCLFLLTTAMAEDNTLRQAGAVALLSGRGKARKERKYALDTLIALSYGFIFA